MARVHVLTAAVLFGTTGTAMALGPGIEPVAVGTARIVVGAVLLVVVALALGGGRLALGRADRRLVLLSGVFVAVYQASFFAAVAETGVAIGTVVALGSAPAFTGLFARAFTHERLRGRWYAATGLACAGVCLLTLGGGGGEVSASGVALALASGAGYAGYAVAGKRMLDGGATPEGTMAAVFAAGALLLSPLLFLVPTGGLMTPEGLALAAYLGALPTALAYVLFARGLEQLGPSETSTLTLAEPVTAMALGFAVLGERPGAAAVVGAGLVLAGLVLLQRKPWAEIGWRQWPRPRQQAGRRTRRPRQGPGRSPSASASPGARPSRNGREATSRRWTAATPRACSRTGATRASRTSFPSG